MKSRLLSIIAGSLVFFSTDYALGSDKVNKVITKDISEVLINPYKGWVSYGDSYSKEVNEINIASLGYRRFEWQELEPESGKVNWSAVDQFIDGWAKVGKRAAFGVMSVNSHSRNPLSVTPSWALEHDSVKCKKNIPISPDTALGVAGDYIEPCDYLSPHFLKNLDGLVRRMADKYDGDPRIAFIDIRSFGNWGESFSKEHLLLYKRNFKKTLLVQASPAEADSLWIVDQGVTVRRDGIGGSHGEELRPAIGKFPTIMEFWGNVDYLTRRHWWLDGGLIGTSLDIGKATYVHLLPDFLGAQKKVIQRYTNRMGYWLRLKEYSYSRVAKGKINLELVWKNDGVSRMFCQCSPILALKKEGDEKFRSRLASSEITALTSGAQYMERFLVNLPELDVGEYQLLLGIADQQSDKPIIKIGSQIEMDSGWYRLGSIRVEN